MTESRRDTAVPPLGDFRHLAGDLTEMFTLRRRLVEAEIRSDLANSRRLAVTAGIGITAALVGLAVLAVVAGRILDEHVLASASFPWATLTPALRACQHEGLVSY